MATLDAWWDGLTLILKIFYAIGMFSTAVLGVQTILALFGLGDHHDLPDMGADLDGHGDVPNFDTDHPAVGHELGDDRLNVLSIRTVIAFLVGFGWIGAACLSSGFGLFLTLLIAGAVGLAMMFTVFGIMRLFWNMREDGSLDYHNAIGEIATVYLPIPGNGEGPGQVEVMIQGRLQVVQAFTSRPDRIDNRAKVLVIDLNEDNSLQVIPDESEFK